MPLLCAECSAFMPAASHARPQASDADPAVCDTYLCTSCTRGLSKCSAGTAKVPLFASAFAIVRGRSRFRARNAPHSFRRLFTLVYKQCYFRLQNALRHGKNSAFCVRFVIDRGRCRSVCRMHCIHSGGFSRSPISDAASDACATYFVQLYTRAFKMFCGTATIPLLTLDRLRH